MTTNARRAVETDDDDANRDPITGAPGAHPLGTGLGAAGGGATGAAVGAVVGGPVGAVVGAAIGGVAGGLAGKGVGEMVNPTVEARYWSDHYSTSAYGSDGTPYAEYAPAYRYGWESQNRYAGQRFEDVEDKVESGWENARGTSTLAWNKARLAVRDAWHRVEHAMPGDADNDGR
jgi:phage tail tape-measure protein